MNYNDPIILLSAPPISDRTRGIATATFSKLRPSAFLGNAQTETQRYEWDSIVAGIIEAESLGGQLLVSTRDRDMPSHHVRRRLLAAAVEVGVLVEHSSKGGMFPKRYTRGPNWT